MYILDFFNPSYLPLTVFLDSFDELYAHLQKPEVIMNVRRLLQRFSDASRSLSVGAGRSSSFLFAKETNVRIFISGLLIHYWPEQSIDHNRNLAQVANIKRVTATLIGAVNHLVMQLNGPHGWAGVSRDEIIGFSDVLGEYYSEFNTWKKMDEEVLKPRIESAMNNLIALILHLQGCPDDEENPEVKIDECYTQLNRLKDRYIVIAGREAFAEFTRHRVQY